MVIPRFFLGKGQSLQRPQDNFTTSRDFPTKAKNNIFHSFIIIIRLLTSLSWVLSVFELKKRKKMENLGKHYKKMIYHF